MPDDADLESRLRDLLRDPGWSLRPRADVQTRIRRAARRQRMRMASFAAGTGVIAAAAVAVPLAVSGGSLHVPTMPRNHSAKASASPVQPAAACVATMPKYYAYLGPVVPGTAGGPLKEATVVGTATGKVTATVDSPRPYVGFDFVAAAGDGGTFVLAAQQARSAKRPEAYFRLTVTPAGHATLTPLSVPVTTQPGFLTGIALSPNGNLLALASNGSPPWSNGSLLQVVNLANGRSRQWTWPNAGSEWDYSSDLAELAWTDNQTLAFLMPVGQRPAGSPELSTAVTQTRVLDAAAPGSNLAASRRVPGKAAPGGGAADMTVAPCGHLIMEFDRAQKVPAPRGIDEVSTATGATVRTLGGGTAIEVFWSNTAGTRLIVLEETAAGHRRLGIVTASGTFTALPAPRTVTADWQYMFTAW